MTPERLDAGARFWVAWTSATVVAAAVVSRRPIKVLIRLGLTEQLSRYTGLLYLGQLIAFWLIAALGQSFVMRRRLPHSRRWGFMTFCGGLVATFAYPTLGALLQPIWTDLFGVRVYPVGKALFVFHTSNLHETFFFALQGAIFGCVLASLQALALPFRWTGRIASIALSALAGAVALAFVWLSNATIVTTPLGAYSGLVLDFVGVINFVSALFWIAYSAIVGIGLHRLMVQQRRSEQATIACAFD